jgi:hypothetical protein
MNNLDKMLNEIMQPSCLQLNSNDYIYVDPQNATAFLLHNDTPNATDDKSRSYGFLSKEDLDKTLTESNKVHMVYFIGKSSIDRATQAWHFVEHLKVIHFTQVLISPEKAPHIFNSLAKLVFLCADEEGFIY